MIFLRFLQRIFPEVFRKRRTRSCPESQRVPGDTKSAKQNAPKSARGTRRDHRRLKKARCRGEREPTTDQKSPRATSFHPENPWRGKLEEEEIIVLPSMVYYRGQGVK